MHRVLKPYTEHNGTQDDPYELWKLDECELLLIPHPEGHWYSNQTGGVACNHPQMRGHAMTYVIPAPLKSLLIDEYNGIGPDTADICDGILTRYNLAFTVDRTKLAQSEEAWLHVVSVFGGAAIMTWENSD